MTWHLPVVQERRQIITSIGLSDGEEEYTDTFFLALLYGPIKSILDFGVVNMWSVLRAISH